MRVLGASVRAGWLALLACACSAKVERTPIPVELPCEIQTILAQNCQSCHGTSPQFGAPMPLVTHADLMATSKTDPTRKVYEAVPERISSLGSPMPPVPYARLGAIDVATLKSWVAKGAPKGECASVAQVPDAGTIKTANCEATLDVVPSSKWTMPQTTADEYVCYGVDITRAQKEHIVGIYPKLDNTKIVHHMILFQGSTAYAATPTPCKSAASVDWRMVGAWAPGTQSIELPAEAGFPVEGTSHFIVQVHYSNLGRVADQADGSGFSFCTTPKLRPYDADVFAFGTTQIQIPARATRDLSCDYTVPQGMNGLHLFAALPHMHQLGKSIQTTLHPKGGGSSIDLGTQPAWSFDSQVWFPLNGTIQEGDTVTTRCVWENSTERGVRFGERTSDEMCYSFTMYYPRVTAPLWTWALPSSDVKCTQK